MLPAHSCQSTRAGEDEFVAGLVAHCLDHDELLSTWCRIMTYLLPRLKTAGNKPVWLAYMRDFTLWLMMRVGRSCSGGAK